MISNVNSHKLVNHLLEKCSQQHIQLQIYQTQISYQRGGQHSHNTTSTLPVHSSWVGHENNSAKHPPHKLNRSPRLTFIDHN